MLTVKNNFGLLEKAILALTKNEVLIGIPDDGSARTPEKGEPSPPSNAVIGYRMETGDPAENLPARPHLVPGVESIRDRVVAIYRAAGKAVLTGDLQAIEAAHDKVGLVAVAAVQQKITDGPFAPLSERTLKRRKARGRTGEKPLLDTGQYRRAFTYVIRRKGQR